MSDHRSLGKRTVPSTFAVSCPDPGISGAQGLEHLSTSKEALNAQRVFAAAAKPPTAAVAQTSGRVAAADAPKKHRDSIVHTVNTEVGVTW